MLKLFITLIIITVSLNAGTKEEIEINKRIDNIENRIFNLEQEMLFLNKNLKRIDKNFETLLTIIKSDRYTPIERIKPVIKNIKKYNIYEVLKDNTNIYLDNKSEIILYKLFKGDIVNIETCECNQFSKKCLCKLKNKDAYIEKNKIIKR